MIRFLKTGILSKWKQFYLNMNHARLFGGTKGLDMKQPMLISAIHLSIPFRNMEFMP
jgi:hypothetical protein